METEQKTHWKKNFDYNYLGSYSLPEGKDIIMTIVKFGKEEVKAGDGTKKQCFVCHFEKTGNKDFDKPMILNKTNCRIMEKLYGSPYTEDWGGKKITIYVSKVKAFGDLTDALRIRDVRPLDSIDPSIYIEKLDQCKTLAELQKTYLSFPKSAQSHQDVVKLKDRLKGELPK